MNTRFNTTSAVSLPEVINAKGNNLIGLEVGVWYGNNMGYLLDNCPNIAHLYGIDPYREYQDWNRFINEDMMQQAIDHATKVLSNFPDTRTSLLRVTSDQFADILRKSGINGDWLDFVFIDGDHSYESCLNDLNIWYDYVKPGGIFSGHDYTLPGVNKAIQEFRKAKNIKGFFKVIPNDVWYWIKD